MKTLIILLLLCIPAAAASRKAKVVDVPASLAALLSPEQQRMAIAEAARRGIKWRIVEDK